MELLVIKSGARYLRIKAGEFTLVGLDKASVFPMAQLETVKVHLADATHQGIHAAVIYRLILTEAPLDEKPQEEPAR
ncbi:conserved hypothetical protein [Desulfosarcina cetonica]|nr:conserved hypothetical protein [Desulfosarcina cetonica]